MSVQGGRDVPGSEASMTNKVPYLNARYAPYE